MPIAATVAQQFRLRLIQSVVEEVILANAGTVADRTVRKDRFALAQMALDFLGRYFSII